MEANRSEIALVTGASSGIGKALVVQLLHDGYEVVGISRSLEKLKSVKEEVRSKYFSIYACDVSEEKSVQEVSQILKREKKIPKLFFLNAGIAGLAALESTEILDLETHQKIFSVNYYGVLHFVKEWLSSCKKNGGATFLVSGSINAIFAPPGGCAYAASKAAIAKAFDGLRLTYVQSKVKFLTVFCGPVDTPGLLGKLPFIWSPKKMAEYMIQRAKEGRAHSYPSRFYAILGRIFNKLSERKVKKILELLHKKH